MIKHFINAIFLVFPCIYESLVVFVPNLELFREIQCKENTFSSPERLLFQCELGVCIFKSYTFLYCNVNRLRRNLTNDTLFFYK